MGFFDKLKSIQQGGVKPASTAAPVQPVDIQAKFKEAKWLQEQANYEGMIKPLVDCLQLAPNLVEKIRSGYRIAFGSSKIEITHDLEKGLILVDCHILNLPDSPKKLPLLRKLLEYNYQKTGLSRFSLEADRVFISFTDFVDYTNPEKLLDGIHEVARFADYYDNTLADEFGATFAYPELAYQQMQERKEHQSKQVQSAKQAVTVFNTEMKTAIAVGDDSIAVDILCGLIYKIFGEYSVTPALLNRMNTTFEEVVGFKENNDKLAALNRCLQEIIRRSWTEAEDFKGEVKQTFRHCHDGSLPIFSGDLQRKLQLVDWLVSRANQVAAYFLLEGTIYRLLYLVNPPADVRTFMVNCLNEADKFRDYAARVKLIYGDLSSLLRSLPVGQIAPAQAGHYGY